MRKILLTLMLFGSLCASDILQNQKLKNAINVLNSFVLSHKNEANLTGIKGIAIFPDLSKAGLGISIMSGKGVFVARNDEGEFSSPFFVDFKGGEFGASGGISSVDLIIFYKNSLSYLQIFNGSDIIGLSAQATVADISANAQIATNAPEFFAYINKRADSRGFYIGVGAQASRITLNHQDTNDYYGRIYDEEDIFNNSPKPSIYTQKLWEILDENFK